jgi:acyl-CoA thioester hydrolase
VPSQAPPPAPLPIHPTAAYRFVHEEPTRWVDLDAMGVVNNSVFLTMFEQARRAYFTALGGMDGERFPFVLGQTALRFLRPGRAGERLRIHCRTTRLGGASFDMDYRIDGPDGDPVVVGTATLVCVDEALGSRPIPPELRRALAEFERLGG